MTHVRFIMSIALGAAIATAAGCGESEEMRQRVQKLDRRVTKLEDLAKQATKRRASVAAAEPAADSAPVVCTVELAKSHDPDGLARHTKQMVEDAAKPGTERTRFEGLATKARAFTAEPRGLPAVPYVSAAFYDKTCELGAERAVGRTDRCVVTHSCEGANTPNARITFPGWRGLIVLIAEGFLEDVGRNTFDPAYFPSYPLHSVVGYEVVSSIRTALLNAIQGDAFPALARWAIPLTAPLIPEEHKAAAKQALQKYWAASGANMPDLEASATASETWVFRSEETRLQGFFLRRWIGTGRGRAGDRVIANLRRAMADAARALEMPEARDWAAAPAYRSRPVAVATNRTARADGGTSAAH